MLVLRPAVAKTLVKGILAIAVFSLFLNVGPSNFSNYLIFLAISFGLLIAFAAIKQMARYELREEELTIKRIRGGTTTIDYRNIIDISVAQGILAKKFNCGSVYIMLNSGRGSVRVLGGGAAEQLDDVPDPQRVCDFISSRIGQF